jgi:protein-S-isoprenylcysteine O-methyltransferase Ste14
MRTLWLFAAGIGTLLAMGTWCGIRLRAEYRTRSEPTFMTVAMVWVLYGIHFILTLVAAVNSTWLFPLTRLLSVAGGILFLTVGASIYVAAVVAFRSLSRLSGLDSSRLITVGIYRWSRNPQSVGWTLFLVGVALLRTSGMVLLLAALLWISFRMYLPLEEQLLERIYGQEYRTYRSQTHRYFGPPKQG